MAKNYKLLKELKQRFKKDQKFANSDSKKFIKVVKENTLWLKEKIKEIGWISSNIVGGAGENYAWLIAQHSDYDVKFQEKCLKLLKKMPLTKKRKQNMAYLTDRILVNRKHKQVYGTQFTNGKPRAIKNPSQLEKRRKSMCLEPFKEYYWKMKRIGG